MSKASFFKLPLFAVVGASSERAKFGNKVLRAFQEKSLNALPISKKQATIEGIPCIDSLKTLSHNLTVETEFPQLQGITNPSMVGVSVVTPPAATRAVLEEGALLGYTNFLLQPGTCDAEVEKYITSLQKGNDKMNIIQGCVLVELGVDPHK
uniref:CoA-binding domain-containing protein n=1 Tax=Spumella elongata TaxID=89044 RepID=A0A7S3GYH1_9STRA|mmetsp:Transcript_2598/g.4338  ORF Transcript_2598/g.4338 Transcript_2598/m.4338 type:complete len:152 (+) Transcript_2598:110-565(+)|eukprot:CAMPEP_0184969136 /NCGR_PEP_ID=MMETSP1098-20130426/1985_1 /TAXON_ID=89044 /ORGANISM="Spumella elongata, Strain CCAP 955/1" /LENGTH=151 /DNA_ID=CAMNT_0027490871 /DNA_START=109 /DNA_END=564 /DNA_ORIENTATION=-